MRRSGPWTPLAERHGGRRREAVALAGADEVVPLSVLDRPPALVPPRRGSLASYRRAGDALGHRTLPETDAPKGLVGAENAQAESARHTPGTVPDSAARGRLGGPSRPVAGRAGGR